MINLYDSMFDLDGNLIEGRIKLFIIDVDAEGNVNRFGAGVGYVPSEKGVLFIVDDYLIDQVDKLKCIDNQLIVKDGMTIDSPKKSAIEIEKPRLLKRLAELENKYGGNV